MLDKKKATEALEFVLDRVKSGDATGVTVVCTFSKMTPSVDSVVDIDGIEHVGLLEIAKSRLLKLIAEERRKPGK